MESAEFIDRKKCISCESDNIIALSSGLFNEGASHEFISNDLWGEDPAPFLKNNLAAEPVGPVKNGFYFSQVHRLV